MKLKLILLFLFLVTLPSLGQEGFQFEKEIEKVVIPFKFINNLIFIPLKVNGIELNFLLDSGVEETILFSLGDNTEVRFFNVEKITLRGLGSESSVEGLKSTNNTLEINGLKSTDHLLYVVLDQSFNISSHIGIPVNGIIGYSFLKNNLVDINYRKKKISVYKSNKKINRKIDKKYERLPITIERSKPYVFCDVTIDSIKIPLKLLIDIGNGDAIWLFENDFIGVTIPEKNFQDYLGKGFSGDVEGKRAKIKDFSISKFQFQGPIAAFPDSSSIKSVKMVQDRAGSVGSEILKRFNIVLDYSNGNLFLKKNLNFKDPFHYNKSGIEVQHNDLQWVKETVSLETPISGVSYDPSSSNITNNFKYKFVLKPIYEISNVRKGSTADLSGLQKGDIIISINKLKTYRFTLQEIQSFLKPDEEKWMTFEVERDNQILIIKFKLFNVL
ncbi:PDZ domain-containing protein [Flavobacterium cellulosilyticum]|uniref:Signal protein PDZ n=1 Tax=Flavobacterium cellulosilyticum TaxID=2541731 RepID=A0A4R5CD48_9FLAO|nr:PDZ domain-containing protein [Flavobacterium cellulosilyticum]TDD96173.1 signal protein PDZ [Flavobacterium cellulosilyticum]